jgi:hypothetical protein
MSNIQNTLGFKNKACFSNKALFLIILEKPATYDDGTIKCCRKIFDLVDTI